MDSVTIFFFVFLFLIAGWIAHLIEKTSNDNTEKIILKLEAVRKLLEKTHEV